MKYLLVIFLFLITNNQATALVSKQEAIDFVIDSIIGPDTVDRKAYIYPDSLPLDTIISTSISIPERAYTNPYEWSWFFFINDNTSLRWTHPCRYAFIYHPGLYMIIYEGWPPELDTLELIFPIGVEETEEKENSILLQCSLNPSAQAVNISYSVPTKCYASLKIYDITGKLVKTLMDKEQASGDYRALWDKTDNTGKKVSAGTYICRLITNGKKAIKLITLP